MSALPVGTLTFLMTDVEASTRTWEREPDAMRQAMVRHDELFENAVEQSNGVNVKPRGEGDSRFAVFTRASDAVAAAVASQQAFASEQWPTDSPVRVRMAVHSGEADLRDNDYYGPTVNRCARLRGIAYGGQTLISLATSQHVRDALPESVTLRDMGQHRLKDLTHPEHVFQLVIPGVENDFPPLLSLDRHPTNLPIQATPFIGRDHEVEEVRELLLDPGTRLVTLTGPGGTGKTRLGLQTAASAIDEFPDGVFMVPLETVHDSDLIIQSIAQALGLRETGDSTLLDAVNEYLSGKTILLLFDNFDQLVEGATHLSSLMTRNAGLKILVTSRVSLQIRGEREYSVPPLGLPDPDRLPPVQQLLDYEAVRLFVSRAQDVKPNFELTEENAAAVVAICRGLDGLPLAIELAAARIRLFSPQAMLKRLDHRLALLTGGARDLPTRQQTLRDTIAWSYDLLDETEQSLFRRLAIFFGGFTLDAAIAVSSDEDENGVMNGPGESGEGLLTIIDVYDSVEALVAKSLLRQEAVLDDAVDDLRFGMLETIREFGLEQLDEAGERDGIRLRHARHFALVAEEAGPQLNGPAQGEWLERLDSDLRNLRAALSCAYDSNDGELGLRLVGALWPFWEINGYFTEGREWIERMLGLEGDPELRARALSGLGTLAWHQGEYPRAIELHTEALTIFEAQEDQRGAAFARSNIGAQYLGIGEFDRAESLFNESLAGYEQTQDELGISDSLNNLAIVAFLQGDLESASDRIEDALQRARARGDQQRAADALHNLGEFAYAHGAYSNALERYQESLRARKELGARAGVAQCLAAIAAILSKDGQSEPAAHLLGAAEALIESTGVSLDDRERERYDETTTELTAELGDSAFASLRKEGRNISLADAMAAALAVTITSGELGGADQPSALASSINPELDYQARSQL